MNGWSNGGGLVLTNENATDLHLLTPAEQQLCSSLRILPKPYLVMKEVLMKEAMKHGGVLKKKVAMEICRVSLYTFWGGCSGGGVGADLGIKQIHVNKISRIHDFFVSSGWIGKA